MAAELNPASSPGLPGRSTWLACVRRGLGVFRAPVLVAIVRRLLLSIPLLFVVSALVFLLTNLIPGDITEVILGPRAMSNIPPETYEELARDLGLDRPLFERYWEWLWSALHGDLGTSILGDRPVTDAITQRFPVTLCLVVGSLLVSVAFGVALGVISAVRGGAVGRAVDVFAMVGWVMPVFWIAAMMVIVFAVKLGWLPATGYVPFAQSPTEWLRSLILPVLALAIAPIGGFAKFTREAMMDALASEYVRMARANGISKVSIVLQHAFKTASLQVVTLAGLLTIGLLIGTVFAEQVFALSGMGSLIVDGTSGRDLPMVQGVAMFFTVLVVVVNLATDVAYSMLSPKVRAA